MNLTKKKNFYSRGLKEKRQYKLEDGIICTTDKALG